MTGPVETNQDEPLDPHSFKHQLLLLKSLHCAKPVVFEGRRQFIQCVTANQSGCDVEMLVYLAGRKDAIDSAQIEIMTTTQQAIEETYSA
jgi:hypothetical protein